MNSFGHLIYSLLKSVVRVMACIGSIYFSSLILLAIGLAFAEVLGILEELVDKR